MGKGGIPYHTNHSLRLHKRLTQYKKRIAEYKEQLKKAQDRPYYNPSRDKPKDEPEVFKETSDEGMKRAFAKGKRNL